MGDTDTERVLHLFLLPELLAIGVLFVALCYSLVFETTLLSSYSRSLRLALAAVLATDLLAPAAVALDMYRSGREIDAVWVHAATLPVINVVGVGAYLLERERLDRQN